MKERLQLLVEIALPLILALIAVMFAYQLEFSSSVARFEKIVDGSITFASIIVGFIGALMGILMSIRDSDIMKQIFDVRGKGLLFYYLSETVMLGFLSVIFSAVMYPFIGNIETVWPFYVWQITIYWFLPSTMRIVFVMMNILFKSNTKAVEMESNNLNEEEREEARRRHAKTKDPNTELS